MKNKKVVYTIIGIVSVALIALAITYAYWQITKSQTNSNIVSSACLDISISEEANDINLQSQYPISDTEGMSLTPYTFTVTNNCNTSIDYQIALESIGDSETALLPSSIKVMLDDKLPITLNVNFSLTPTLNEAYESYKLGAGTLKAKGEKGDSVTHELRLWIDYDAPVSEANKTFESKVSITVAQNIVNSIKDGTLAYSIVNTYKSDAKIGKLSGLWHPSALSEEKAKATSSTSSVYWGTEYNLNEDNGRYSVGGDVIKATISECRAGLDSEGNKITCGKYTILNPNLSSATRPIYVVESLYSDTKADSSNLSYITIRELGATNDYYLSNSNGEYGLYEAEDDYGTSYYYRGDVPNNYVKFGIYPDNSSATYISGYSGHGCDYVWNEELEEEEYICSDKTMYDTSDKCYEAVGASYEFYCDPVYESAAGKAMYWRIVRINGDGTIRLAYDGVNLISNGTSHYAYIKNDVKFNSSSNNKMYVGYMYGTEDNPYENINDSLIKDELDSWYEANLKTTYGSYIADSIFCNDREEYSNTYSGALIEYTGAKRVPGWSNGEPWPHYAPVLTCAQQNDRFTVEDEVLGNGHLTNPIGLLTADEVLMAGLTETSYLYSGTYFTMTPSHYSSSSATVVIASTSLGAGMASNSVRPVINLKADVEFTGTGTIDDPYVITTN